MLCKIIRIHPFCTLRMVINYTPIILLNVEYLALFLVKVDPKAKVTPILNLESTIFHVIMYHTKVKKRRNMMKTKLYTAIKHPYHTFFSAFQHQHPLCTGEKSPSKTPPRSEFLHEHVCHIFQSSTPGGFGNLRERERAKMLGVTVDSLITPTHRAWFNSRIFNQNKLFPHFCSCLC